MARVKADAARKAAAVPEGALEALVAGYVDTCGFVALFGLFTAHVTGNLVLIGATIVDHRGGVVPKLLAVPVFIAAVAATRSAILALEARGRNPAVPLLGLQILLLAGFMACGLAASPVTNTNAPLPLLAGMLGVAAMAIQNTASRTFFSAYTSTTVMTSNVTQLVIDLTDLAHGCGTAETRSRLARTGPMLICFTGGAFVAALAYAEVGFWCLVVPIAVLAVLCFRETGRTV